MKEIEEKLEEFDKIIEIITMLSRPYLEMEDDVSVYDSIGMALQDYKEFGYEKK